jgi:uncharacterized protein (TIGR03089 family)
MPHRTPTTVADVLSALVTAPGRPRLTWYGPDGERIELSGAVLDNWVSKTTNLLVEEMDVAPGRTVLLDLPPHWRTVVWALATWRTGATLALAGAAADVVVTDRPGTDAPGAATIAVALPALARRFDGVLPAGAIDAAQAVMTYGDVIGWAPPVDPGAPVLAGAAGSPAPGSTAHADLIATAAAALAARAAGSADPGREPGARTLLLVDADRATTREVLLTVLGLLAEDGSVVLLAPDAGATPEQVAARADRISADERVTARH